MSEVPRGAAEEGRLIAGLLEQIEDARRLFQHDAERVGVRIVVNVDRQMRERHPERLRGNAVEREVAARRLSIPAKSASMPSGRSWSRSSA